MQWTAPTTGIEVPDFRLMLRGGVSLLMATSGPPVTTLRQRLLDVPSTIDRVELLQRSILARVRDVPFEAEAEALAVSLVHRRRGALTVRELADSVGMGPRQLERRFKDTVGVSPKTFIRIARFQALASQAVSGNHANWAALATDLGFSDQAHMIREFRSFAGETPVSFARETRELAVAFGAAPSSGGKVSGVE